MILNLCLGTVVISLTVLIHTFGLIAVTHAMARLVDRFRMHGRRSRIAAMISVVMGLFAIITTEVWLWAGVYLTVGVLPDFETALFFHHHLFDGWLWRCGAGARMARPGSPGRRERVFADRLVDRLSDRCRNPHRPLQGRRALLNRGLLALVTRPPNACRSRFRGTCRTLPPPS